jgi:hypothetical protein
VAPKFRVAAVELMDEFDTFVSEQGWKVKGFTIGQTEGGAGTLTVRLVQALDGDESLNGTPMGDANGTSRAGFGDFAAPRAHRPGAEGEQ